MQAPGERKVLIGIAPSEDDDYVRSPFVVKIWFLFHGQPSNPLLAFRFVVNCVEDIPVVPVVSFSFDGLAGSRAPAPNDKNKSWIKVSLHSNATQDIARSSK
jgi:hypothetical protein